MDQFGSVQMADGRLQSRNSSTGFAFVMLRQSYHVIILFIVPCTSELMDHLSEFDDMNIDQCTPLM